MAIRDVFFPLLNYPEPTDAAAIDTAVDLAENLSKPCDNSGTHRQIRTRISALVLETEIEAGLYFEGALTPENSSQPKQRKVQPMPSILRTPSEKLQRIAPS